MVQILVQSLIPLSVFLMMKICTPQAEVVVPKNATISAIFMFGDSIVDTGNNNHLVTLVKSNFPPYGRDFMGGKPTGRFSNGKVPADLFAEKLGIKELLPAFLDPNLQLQDLIGGVNFASAGAGFDPLTSELVLAIPMSKQLQLFDEYKTKLKSFVGEERADYIVTNGLYIELHAKGARRISVCSLTPLGCIPSQRTLAGGIKRRCAEGYNKMVQLFNSELSSELRRLNGACPHARMALLDVYGLVFDMVKNPRKYGFEISDRGCCGSGLIETGFLCNRWNFLTCLNVSGYVFWDSYHPAENVYKIMVQKKLGKLLIDLYS
ncbi:GDSL esterase/lipase At5g42170-like isoform X4 [Rhodamnia argentea]|uniref:GDSL esterase/lipase At5g42170-like isoform X4 n=1 Tax=Rhodamnia argentea TaxID=178133 RepID=A0ABM3GZP7_9MYRT|nr:GDSL esterase/lipase At5g42170-like isoform X4 [Rhodamnia argentea]